MKVLLRKLYRDIIKFVTIIGLSFSYLSVTNNQGQMTQGSKGEPAYRVKQW